MKILLPFLLIASACANSGLLEMLINDKVIANSDLPTEQTQAETIQGDPFTRFFVVGDYGDLTKYNDLHRVTDFMEYLSTQETYDFIATVGDNVYENGIQHSKKPHLENIPMYVTLGNHDCYSDYNNEVKFREFDKQWNMESDYYIRKIPLKDNPQKYFALLMANSCLLDCMVSFAESNKDDCKMMNIEVGGQLVKAHYAWIEENLSKLSEDPNVIWTGIVMHHSLLVVPAMKQELLPILQKYKIDMAIVGHNHMFEYSNIGYSEQIKFPGKKYGPVIDDCHGKKDIINTPTRYQQFKKGERLHQSKKLNN